MPRSLETILRTFGWQERFHIHERIGEGGMGQVWRARERESGREVALKILLPERSENEHSLARLEVEGATLMRLRAAGGHDHVVPVLDFKVTQDHACLVMEFIPGQNLRKWCSSHRLGLRERAGLIAQVARAAGWFHQLGVIHRDLKPANILVSAHTHEPVIVDFSIAKVEETLTLTLTNEALGTAPYMAPEQFDRRRADISPATDVYALGATLYELLTEVPPHPGDLPVILQRHADEARPARPSALNPAIPRDLESILLKALSPRPADRYADGAALADDLGRFLAGQPVHARPISRLTHLARQARRKPGLTAALAACLSLGTLAAWSAHFQARERQRFTLESRLAAAMQNRQWTLDEIRLGESWLSELATCSPVSASEYRSALFTDIVFDIEHALQKNHLEKDELAWIKDALAWLDGWSHPETDRLKTTFLERGARWEVLGSLHPPFEIHGSKHRLQHRLFPGQELRVEADALHPPASPAGQVKESGVYLAHERIFLPVEVTTQFQAAASNFTHFGIRVSHDNTSSEVLFCRFTSAPASVQKALNDQNPGHEDFVLALLLHGEPLAVRLTGFTPALFSNPVQLQLRVESRHIEAYVNGRELTRYTADVVLGSRSRANQCHLIWPQGVALKGFTLRTRAADAVSPLEQGDVHMLAMRWRDAHACFEELRGDPFYGIEASYKAAHCLRKSGNMAAAMDIWALLASGSPGIWQERASFQIWAHTAKYHGVTAAASLLDAVPRKMPPAHLREFGAGFPGEIARIYHREGYGIGFPGVDAVRITQAVRACILLGSTPTDLVNRFGIAQHLAKLDSLALSQYEKALEIPRDWDSGSEEFRLVVNCFDQWSRLHAMAPGGAYSDTLDRWAALFPDDPTFLCLTSCEEARQAARAVDVGRALQHIHDATAQTGADDRRLVTAWLIAGLLHRMNGAESAAQAAWQQGLQLARSVRYRSPLHLWDCVHLHSLTRTWDIENATNVLGTLFTMDISSGGRRGRYHALGRLMQTLFSNPGFLHSLNQHLSHDGESRRISTDYVLCQDTFRSLVERHYRHFLQHAFRQQFFPDGASAQENQRLQRAVSQLVTRMTLQPEDDATDLHAFFRAWSDPSAARLLLERTDYPHPPELVEDLKWLLRQRNP